MLLFCAGDFLVVVAVGFWGGGGDAGLEVVGVRRLGLELSYSFRFQFIWVLGLAHLFWGWVLWVLLVFYQRLVFSMFS